MSNKREHYKGQFATNTDSAKILLLEREVEGMILSALQSPLVSKHVKFKLRETTKRRYATYDWATEVALEVAAAINKSRFVTKPLKIKPYPPTNNPE